MRTVLIGIDDTDNAESRGTGHLARLLAAECQGRGMRCLGVTRHQFLLDPRIPYTSHNSGASLAVSANAEPASVAFAFDFVAAHAAEGSDPGVCVAEADAVPAAVIEFARLTTRRVVQMSEALAVAAAGGIALRPLGGTGQGVIGALGSVGLRAEGNEGRFIDLPGLRELPARASADDLTRLGIRVEYHAAGRLPTPADEYETFGWARPRLLGGEPVLPVEWSEECHAWVPVDRKTPRSPK